MLSKILVLICCLCVFFVDVSHMKAISELPNAVLLDVPFTSQAPLKNWGEPFDEACEETAILMVHAFNRGHRGAFFEPKKTQKAIRDMVAKEKKLFGFYIHTDMKKTGELAEKYFGDETAEVVEDPTIDWMKQTLMNGNPIIVPAQGQLLRNPHFKSPGPPYHVFVVIGYTKDNHFIVNEPGTRHGSKFLYSFETVMTAMHDWNAKDIMKGKKNVLILHPKK